MAGLQVKGLELGMARSKVFYRSVVDAGHRQLRMVMSYEYILTDKAALQSVLDGQTGKVTMHGTEHALTARLSRLAIRTFDLSGTEACPPAVWQPLSNCCRTRAWWCLRPIARGS